MQYETNAEIIDNELKQLRCRVAQLEMQQRNQLQNIAPADSSVTRPRPLSQSNQNEEPRIHEFFNNVSTAIQEYNIAGVITFSNPAFSKLLGYENEELVGKQIYEFLYNETEQGNLRRKLAELAREQATPIPFISKIRTKVGYTIDVELVCTIIRDDSGIATGFVAVVVDRDLVRHQFRALFSASPLAVMFSDTERRITICNPAVLEMFGYSDEELIGKTTKMLYPDALGFVEQGERRFNSGAGTEKGFYEVQFKRKDNSVIWTESYGNQVKDSTGNVIGFIGMFRDITERKNAEHILNESEERARIIIEVSPVANWVVDAKGKTLIVNSAWTQLTGYSAEEAQSDDFNWQKLTSPEFRELDLQAIEQVRNTGTHTPFEKEIVRKDGTKVPVFVGAAFLNKETEIGVGYLIDLTEKKRAENALKEQEQQFRLFSQSTGDCFWNWDVVAGTVNRSIGFQRAFGYSTQEIQPGIEWWAARLHPDDKEGVFLKLEKAVAACESICEYEYRFCRRDGSYAFIHDHVCILRDTEGTVIRYLGAMQDISERKQNEIALKRSHVEMERRVEQRTTELRENNRRLLLQIEIRKTTEMALSQSKKRLRDIIDGLFGFIGLYTTDGILIEANAAPMKAAGLKKEDVIGKPFWETYWWSYSPSVQTQLKESLQKAANGETVRYDVAVRIADNQFIDIDVMFGPLYDSDGNVTQLLGFGVDITARNQTEKQFSDLVEFAPEAMVILNDRESITLINTQAEQLFGYHRDELIGKAFRVLFTNKPEYEAGKLTECFLAQTESSGTSFEANVNGRRKDGSELCVEISFSSIKSEVKSIVIATIRDITKRLQTEEDIRQYREQLAHVVRLSTMGEMATSLAHELNQPLAAIATYCHAGSTWAKKEMPNESRLGELFEKSEKEVLRAGAIIRRLSSMVRKKAPVRTVVDLVKSINDVLQIMNTDIQQLEIRVELQLEQTDCLVVADEIQIQQVLVNLIRNSLDAMRKADHNQRILKITTFHTAGGLIEVAIRDTGEGFPIERKEQVFDAFFTTKPEGLGMGLAISRTIIESHEGQLWVIPNSGPGVTFHLTLPFSTEGCNIDEK